MKKSRKQVRWKSAGILQSQPPDSKTVAVRAVISGQSIRLSPEGSRSQGTGGEGPM